MPPGFRVAPVALTPLMTVSRDTTKRIYGDAKWPEHLADGFLDHAHKLKHKHVFDPPWKQLM